MTANPDATALLIWELRRAFRELARAADRFLRPLGLTAGDRALLEFLVRAGGPMSMAELARTYNVSRQHIHQALARDPLKSLVAIRSDPKDGRARRLVLNARGRALWAQVQQADGEFLDSLTGVLSPETVALGARALMELRAGLNTLQGEPNEPQ